MSCFVAIIDSQSSLETKIDITFIYYCKKTPSGLIFAPMHFVMDNHVHLAVQVTDIPLAKILQNLSFRYTRWVNWQQQRVGHLFQGRYKAILVEKDTYLMELIRYIHLNPQATIKTTLY